MTIVLPHRRFCIAPMMDWTDRHCRYFLRLLSQKALLYTEMVVAQALHHARQAPDASAPGGRLERLLGFDPIEKLHVSDGSVFDNFGQTGAHFPRGQGAQGR